MDNDVTEEVLYFTYINKDEYFDKKRKLFDELKRIIYVPDIMFRLISYSGIKDCYKCLKINDVLKKHLNSLTNYKQPIWVKEVCWHVYRTVECAFDSLPLLILKRFDNKQLESYIYDIIYSSLIGGDTEGFMSFIEEKNVYMEEEEDLIEELPINEDTVMELDTELIN